MTRALMLTTALALAAGSAAFAQAADDLNRQQANMLKGDMIVSVGAPTADLKADTLRSSYVEEQIDRAMAQADARTTLSTSNMGGPDYATEEEAAEDAAMSADTEESDVDMAEE